MVEFLLHFTNQRDYALGHFRQRDLLLQGEQVVEVADEVE